MKYCTKCGRRTDTAARYCTGCGAEFPPRPPGSPAADFLNSGQAAARPSRPSRRRTTMIAAVVVVVAALAGVAAWRLTGHQAGHRGHAVATGLRGGPAARPGGSAPSGPSASPSAASPGSSSPSGGTGPATSPAASAPVSPSPPVTASAPGSGSSGTVTIGAGAAGQAGAQAVAAFLVSYFTAINQHDYQAYVSLLDRSRQGVPSRAKFRSGYRTTTDSGETLTGLSAYGSELAATITFRSHQDPADSATGTACTSWQITLYLEPGGGTYLIGAPRPGYHAAFGPCS